jgi:hypothetical protein
MSVSSIVVVGNARAPRAPFNRQRLAQSAQ